MRTDCALCVFAISLCVISADRCRKVYLSYLLVFSRTGSMWPPRTRTESSDNSVSLFLRPQIVRHLVAKMQKGQLMSANVSSCDFYRRLWVILADTSAMVLMVSPCVSTHSQYVISSCRSSKVCSRCLVLSLSDCAWFLLINSVWLLLMFFPKGCTSFLFLEYSWKGLLTISACDVTHSWYVTASNTSRMLMVSRHVFDNKPVRNVVR